jgi:hypothetical protein
MQPAEDLQALSDDQLAAHLKVSTRGNFKTAIRPLVNALAAAAVPQTPEHLAETLGCTPESVIKNLTRIVAADPRLMQLTAEFMPDVYTVIGMVEGRIGPITGVNLAEANQVCSAIVDGIVRPRHRSFVRRRLAASIGADDRVALPLDDLISFLLGDYKAFSKQQAQGLTSKAGGLNEAILTRALTNAGLREDTDFEVTGNKGAGDLAVYCDHVRPRATLLVEVKSYGARERLLRGLQDIQPPKIGVGFFNSASEFNAERTNLFLATQSLAIYMPRLTFEALDPVASARVNALNTPFYRPLDLFVPDLQAFVQRGQQAYAP